MTGKERISKILKHEKTDRIGLYEHFWGDTMNEWRPIIGDVGNVTTKFGFDMNECWPTNISARVDFNWELVCEDENTATYLDGNWATLRRHKKHDTTPEHISFGIDSRAKWEELAKPLITDDSLLEKRINFDAYRNTKRQADENGQFFMWSGVNVFECMHPIVGHEEMLCAMIYDPEWIEDMAQTYADLTIKAQKLLFEREGYPDGIWYYEDMGYKGAPFMSPEMYKRFIFPSHKKTCEFAHSHSLPVIMHSCGFIEPLLPYMIEAGIDALQAMEVKAGMDLLRIYENYGDKIALIGGMDVREIYSNDKARIDAMLERIIPVVKQGYAYVLHSDHSIPKTVTYDTYQYFIKKGLELGKY
ncbi:MAG: hypothetical protein E7315_01250 [Clostridiales bacterium]|nr:hypothetical protein [Clostridiales bacterium]